MADTRTDKDWQDIVADLLPSLERREDSEYPSYPVPSAPAELAQYIDHTLLKLDATKEEIEKLCEEAKQYNFKSVCVREGWVSYCASLLSSSPVVVASVVGFHSGTDATASKVAEAKRAVSAGARELDMVIHHGLVVAGQVAAAYHDVRAVRMAAPAPTVLKVILETSQLERAGVVAGCVVALAAGADYVKTSTGFNGRGASLDDVRLMKAVVGDAARVKASGGVRTTHDATAMIAAGAHRIGASSGVAIVNGQVGTAAY